MQPSMRFAPGNCPDCGELAEGTLESIAGQALLVFDEDGDADYAGETKIDWNSQVTVRDAKGRVILECPSGHRWQATLTDLPWKEEPQHGQ